jgi:uncharacterized protein
LPAYRAGDVSGGTVAGAREIVRAIGDVSYAPAQAASDALDAWVAIVVLILVPIQLIGPFLAKTKSWWFGGAFGAVVGAIGGFEILGTLTGALGATIALSTLGFLIDFVLSKLGPKVFHGGGRSFGGRSGGGGGGGFGGFGGGSSGGGGGGGRW